MIDDIILYLFIAGGVMLFTLISTGIILLSQAQERAQQAKKLRKIELFLAYATLPEVTDEQKKAATTAINIRG